MVATTSRTGFNKALIAGALLTAFAGSVWAEPMKIAIANFGDHPQLNESVTGFKKQLAKEAEEAARKAEEEAAAAAEATEE